MKTHMSKPRAARVVEHIGYVLKTEDLREHYTAEEVRALRKAVTASQRVAENLLAAQEDASAA